MQVSGGFEVPSGASSPSPPSSPDSERISRPALQARRRSRDAAYHITEECERLFCETLKAVFLVEKDTGLENSLVMDMRMNTNSKGMKISAPKQQQSTILQHDMPTPSPSPNGQASLNMGRMIQEYVEVWDYACGARFRGFVAEKGDLRSLFVFFDQNSVGQDLKPGYVYDLSSAIMDWIDIVTVLWRFSSSPAAMASNVLSS